MERLITSQDVPGKEAVMLQHVSKIIAVVSVAAASLIAGAPAQAAEANFGQCMTWVAIDGAGSGNNNDYAPGQTGVGPNANSMFDGSMVCPK